MFSQFAEEDKTLSAVFRSDVMHMFCLQLHVCLDTFFGPETDQGSNGVPRVVVYFVTRGYIYIFIWRDQRWGEETRSVDTAGFLNDK